jgi:L-rhamnose isomerase
MTEGRDEAAVERPDDDDHDLLTFGEAGARLQLEIRAVRERIAELERGRPVDETTLGSAQERLAALEEGAARNSAQPINDENFERFFGYPGKAKRNTDW